MIDALLSEIVSHGDRGAVVPFSRIDDLKKDMTDLKNREYHTSWLDRMADWMTGGTDGFVPSDLRFKPLSLISVIIPNPKAMLYFQYQGKVIPCAVPPHYTHWDVKNKQVLQYIQNYLTPFGFSASIVRTIPQKLLAVHSGLCRYGRNNICYHDEFGSYMQIMSYISDLPCDDTAWFPIRRMKNCEKCSACVTACPTGAIDLSRRLIDSDRCITFFDDEPGEFPAWIEKDMHNSVVGCTRCQDCCPGNAQNKNNIAEGVTFTEEETTELINHKTDEPYTDSLAAKIESTGILLEYVSVLPRNVAALLQNI